MAGGGVVSNGPFSNIETPAQKAARIAAQSKGYKADLARQNESAAHADFTSNARGKVNYSMAYTDPNSGLSMRYDPETGGGSASSGSRSSGSGGGATSTPERVSLDALMADYNKISGQAPPPVVGPSRASRTAANDAAFGAAKAKIGLMNRASVNALHDQMGERGISGSGIEAENTASIIGAGQHDLAQTVLGQTTADLSREQDVEDRNYAGGITQRAQDMQQQQAKRQAIQALFDMRTGPTARLY